MPEDNFSQQESLALIESMINKAKNQFSENGFVYLLWGWVILICSLSQFILQKLNYPKYYLVWILTWVALLVQLVYYARHKKLRMVKTYTHDIIGYVWLAFFIMMVLTGIFTARFLNASQHHLGNIAILTLYGMPTFLSGIILKFRPLVIGGICCWLLAIIAGFVPPQYTILFITAAVIAAWIIPGYLLRSKYKKENFA